MPTHVHFHDFLQSDRKPFEEAKHKRSHGKFAKMAGGANPGLKERVKPPGTAKAGVHARPHQQPQSQPRVPSWQRGAQQVKSGAAAAVAAAYAKAKAAAQAAGHGAREVGKEAFGVEHDIQTLTRGLSDRPLKERVSTTLRKNIPEFLGNMVKENVDTVVHGVAGLKALASGQPRTPEQTKAFMSAGIKFAIIGFKWGVFATTGIPLVFPGVGALGHAAGHLAGHAAEHLIGGAAAGTLSEGAQHLLEGAATQVVEHAADEHATKAAGSGVRAALFGPKGEQQEREMQKYGGDRAFRDTAAAFRDAGISQADMKIFADWLNTVAECVATTPIDVKKIMASAPKANGDSRFGPMFGGLKSSGNRLLDEGTSEGAKKGWEHRQHGGAKPSNTKSVGGTGAGYELRKKPAETPTEKPSFAEMHEHRLDVPKIERKRKRSKPHRSPRNPTPAVMPEHGDPVRADPQRKAAPPSSGTKTQAASFGQGGPRESGERTTKGKNLGGVPQRVQVSMKQKEQEGPAKEARAAQAQAHHEEMRELHRRQSSGEKLSEKEETRLKRLTGIYGTGVLAPPTSQKKVTKSPPKVFIRSKGAKRWWSRKPF